MNRKRYSLYNYWLIPTIFMLTIIITSGCAFAQTMRREPEIPVELLLERQLEVLGPEWSFGGGEIWTDRDFTYALWTVWTGFDYSDNIQYAREEIHIFPNSSQASILRWPSPASVNIEEGRTPKGWTYEPTHADWFVLDCKPAHSPESCRFIVRYEEYIIYFYAPITEYMTLDDLEEIIRVTDDTMYEYLLNSKLKAGPRPIPNQGELNLSIQHSTDTR